MSASRAQVASSFTLIKGAMIEESYAVLAGWELSQDKRENLARLREQNFIGARSETWLRDVAKVFNRRFDPAGRDRPLTVLAQRGCDMATWKPILLWHITRDEFVLRDFLTHWLFPAYRSGSYRVRPDDLRTYLRGIARRGATIEHAWSDNTVARVAAGLLKMAVDFGLLRGSGVKEFATPHLPDRALVYLVHALTAVHANAGRVIHSPDWHMFLMDANDVERELARLHQLQRLGYHVAGSLAQLTLPFAGPLEYAEAMVA